MENWLFSQFDYFADLIFGNCSRHHWIVVVHACPCCGATPSYIVISLMQANDCLSTCSPDNSV